MNRQWINAYKTSLALFAANMLLLLILVAEWQFHVLSRDHFAQSLKQKPGQSGLSVALPKYESSLGSEDAYLAIVNQPLFLEGRLPVENTEEVPQNAALTGMPVSSELNLSLSGVALLPDSMLVLLTDKGGKHFRVKKGETIQGWEVESVQNDKIMLTNGTEHREVLLREFKHSQKPPPPGAAQQASQPPQLAPPQSLGDGNADQESIEMENTDPENADSETESQ